MKVYKVSYKHVFAGHEIVNVVVYVADKNTAISFMYEVAKVDSNLKEKCGFESEIKNGNDGTSHEYRSMSVYSDPVSSVIFQSFVYASVELVEMTNEIEIANGFIVPIYYGLDELRYIAVVDDDCEIAFKI